MAIIGIDLGTTNSLATQYTSEGVKILRNSSGNALIPSVVGLDDDGNIIVGEVAKERLITHPDLTVAEFKRTMGTDLLYELGKKNILPSSSPRSFLRRSSRTPKRSSARRSKKSS